MAFPLPLPVHLSSLSQDIASSMRLLGSGLGTPPRPHHVPTSYVDHTRICHLKRPRNLDFPGPQEWDFVCRWATAEAVQVEMRSLTSM